jgi:hypothetical protein
MKPPEEARAEKRAPKPKPWRLAEVRRIIEEYADDLREIIKRLRQMSNDRKAMPPTQLRLCEPVTRPSMRFVPIKSADQQAPGNVASNAGSFNPPALADTWLALLVIERIMMIMG